MWASGKNGINRTLRCSSPSFKGFQPHRWSRTIHIHMAKQTIKAAESMKKTRRFKPHFNGLTRGVSHGNWYQNDHRPLGFPMRPFRGRWRHVQRWELTFWFHFGPPESFLHPITQRIRTTTHAAKASKLAEQERAKPILESGDALAAPTKSNRPRRRENAEF